MRSLYNSNIIDISVLLAYKVCTDQLNWGLDNERWRGGSHHSGLRRPEGGAAEFVLGARTTTVRGSDRVP